MANFVGPSSGGMKTAVKALGSGYVASGAHRLLVIPGPRDARSSTSAGDVVQLRAPRVGGGYRLMLEPWRVTDVLEEFGPTSLEISDKSTLLPITRWANKNGVASVLFSHERLDAMLPLRTGWDIGLGAPVSVLNRVLVRQFDAIVVTSAFAKREFATRAQASGTPLHRIPLGVDLETFRPQAVRAPGGLLRLVYAGRLSREKSPQLAVATAMTLHERGVPVRLDVYGDGPQRGELEEIARDAPVVFHGHVSSRSELSSHLAAADVALSVCPAETFGLAVLEALASGTPVVTANVGGARELVDERSGAWSEPEPGALADVVLDLAGRTVAARRAAARRRAEEFPWTNAVESMLSLHCELSSTLDKPGQPRSA